jgi:hypothetical protein
MKVKDIMTSQPLTCGPDTNLAAAAALMRRWVRIWTAMSPPRAATHAAVT